jgi:thiosulfate/3-mercaptopyruvate sulfurtransferase
VLSAVLGLALAGDRVAADDGQARSSASITAAALRDLVDAGAGTKVIDVRSAEDHERGHVPGALHLDRRTFDNPDQAADGKVASPEVMNGLLSGLGLARTDDLVVYGGGRSLQMATRLWWLLGAYGHQGQVRVLDGGFEAWAGGGHPCETGAPVAPARSTYVVTPFDAAQLVDADGVARRTPDSVLLDVRDLAEFTGERVSAGAARGGRIPGAVHVHFKDALDEAGRLRAAADLRRLYEERGVTADKEIIIYCMRGHRASHTMFVLRELLGYPRVRIYNGSWIEWSNDPARPAATGAE